MEYQQLFNRSFERGGGSCQVFSDERLLFATVFLFSGGRLYDRA
jgi:hypothetical protein